MAGAGRVTPLYSKDDHHCLLFTGMVSGEGIESNQFVIVHKGHAALFDPGGDLGERMISLPDEGGEIPLGDSSLVAVPAHFLHSVGNFHFYDPTSGILFTGDVGAAVGCGPDHIPVENFADHVRYMQGFHRRYMAGNRACRAWAARVRRLDPEMLVPQHGQPFVGKPMVKQFLDWFEQLQCGIDLLGE